MSESRAALSAEGTSCGADTDGHRTQSLVCATKLLNPSLLSAATIFLGRLSQQLVELTEGSPRDGENCNEDGSSALGDVIAMSARHFLDEAMSPQQPAFPADGSRAPSWVFRCVGWGRVEQGLEVAVAEAVDEEVAVSDRRQEIFVVGPGTQSPEPPSREGCGF